MTHGTMNNPFLFRAYRESIGIDAEDTQAAGLSRPLAAEKRGLRAKTPGQQPPATHQCQSIRHQAPAGNNQGRNDENSIPVEQLLHVYALAAPLEPRGRKYCVPRIGSLTRLSSSCRSVWRSTKSMSLVLTTSRSHEG